jgi:hypothetical protein
MASSGVKLVFDEHFSPHQVWFINHESRVAQIVHTRKCDWSGKEDKEWMPHAIGSGFVIVSADRNEKTRGFTVADLKTMGARVILIGGFWAHLSRWEKAKWLVRWTDKIVKTAAEMSPGEVVLIANRNCAVRSL